LNYREAECRFTFGNTGTGPLEVSIEKASCGCTSQILSGAKVAPGQAGEMLLTYKGRKEKPRIGVHSLSVELATNDPENASFVFTARMKLVDQVYVEPESIDLREGVDAQPLRIFCMDDAGTPEVLSVEASGGALAVEKLGEEVREGATVHEYRVARVGPAREGERPSIIVKTSSARVPAIEAPVTVSAERVLDASPARVLFGVVKAGRVVEKGVAIEARKESVDVAGCTSSDEAVAAVLAKGTVAGAWRVTVRLIAPAVSEVETIKSEVAIRDGSGGILFTLPVVATVAP
jgi:hypothetical protein